MGFQCHGWTAGGGPETTQVDFSDKNALEYNVKMENWWQNRMHRGWLKSWRKSS